MLVPIQFEEVSRDPPVGNSKVEVGSIAQLRSVWRTFWIVLEKERVETGTRNSSMYHGLASGLFKSGYQKAVSKASSKA